MAESVSALQTQLTAIDAAITAAETAQSVGSDGTSISRANLATLYARRDVIQRRLETAQSVAAGRSRIYARGRTRFLDGLE